MIECVSCSRFEKSPLPPPKEKQQTEKEKDVCFPVQCPAYFNSSNVKAETFNTIIVLFYFTLVYILVHTRIV